MSCGHTLAWHDLFPVLSWVFLRGKCRYCKEKVSGRYALVETICGLSYVLAFLVFDFTINLGFALILSPILICTAFFDFDTEEIEYWCPISIAGLGVIALVLSLTGVIDTVWYTHIIGAFAVSVPFFILLFFGAMGGGDTQLMAAAGLLLGWNILPAAFVGFFLGSIVGLVYKIAAKPEKQALYVDEDGEPDGIAPKGTVIRFGPCLAVGVFAGFLYGQNLIEWYFSLMG
jgi:leader peptidase (prepilin peptidase)/N-methyltransferase